MPGAEEVLALLELRLQALSRRLGRHRRRLRPHRRDAAAAGPAGGAGLVHAAGLPDGAAGGQGAQAGADPRRRGADAGRQRLRRHRAAARRARRGARAALRARGQRAAGADPRAGGAGRGAALATRPCRCSATASTAWSPTGSSRPPAPTTGARAGCWPRTRCWPRSTSPSPGSRCGARSTAPSEPVGVEALTELAGDAVRRRPTRWRPAAREGPFRVTRQPRRCGAAAGAAVRQPRPRSTWRATATSSSSPSAPTVDC